LRRTPFLSIKVSVDDLLSCLNPQGTDWAAEQTDILSAAPNAAELKPYLGIHTDIQ